LFEPLGVCSHYGLHAPGVGCEVVAYDRDAHGTLLATTMS
jgi:hypothetical protein